MVISFTITLALAQNQYRELFSVRGQEPDIAGWLGKNIEVESKWPWFFRHIFECIFLTEKSHILIQISLNRPRQNGRHFADDIFKHIFLNKNVSISIKISLKFVPKGLMNNIPSLVQIMAWRRPGDKPSVCETTPAHQLLPMLIT